MGDMAVTEGWAVAVRGPACASRPGSSGASTSARPREFAAEGGVIDLFFARRYAAKLLYELEFYRADDPDDDARPLRRAARRRPEDRAEPRRTTWPTSTRAST